MIKIDKGIPASILTSKRFGGRLKQTDIIYHVTSDKKEELIGLVKTLKLPLSLLDNPHFKREERFHLDVWGKPAEKIIEFLGKG